MKNRVTRIGLILALSAPLTLADFRYDQSSRMTGGAMMAMMKMAARFSKGALDPVNSTIAVKGNRMVMNHNGKTASIWDIDKETITDINFEKKEYSVTTFAEMRAFMEKAMKDNKSSANTSMEIDVKETGKTQSIAGYPAREFLMTMKVEAMDPQTGKKGEMKLEMSNWMTAKLPGYDEVAGFHKRMAEKMDMAGMFGGMGQAGMGAGMAAAAKKMAAMDGVPVLQIMRMIPTDPEQLKKMEEAQKAQAAQGEQPQGPTAGQAAGQAAGDAATREVAGRMGRIGGLSSAGLGGLGGLRRKKKEEPPPPPPPPAETTAAAAPAAGTSVGSFSSEASMMEMTIESKNHSNSSVEDSMFAIPGGFKTVKSPMQR